VSLLVRLSQAAGRVVANGADNARGLSKAANPEFGNVSQIGELAGSIAFSADTLIKSNQGVRLTPQGELASLAVSRSVAKHQAIIEQHSPVIWDCLKRLETTRQEGNPSYLTQASFDKIIAKPDMPGLPPEVQAAAAAIKKSRLMINQFMSVAT
jgi:hypothetical protein